MSIDLEHGITDANIRELVKIYLTARDQLPKNYQDISKWDVSNVTNMSNLFSNYLEEIGYQEDIDIDIDIDINDWDVSNVTDMGSMFEGVYFFNNPLDKWNVSNVTNMGGMFSRSSFNQNINNWNVSNVTNMTYMFEENYEFNQPLNKWNVSNVQMMSGMFHDAGAFNQSLDNWNINPNVYINSETDDLSNDIFGGSGMTQMPKWVKKQQILPPPPPTPAANAAKPTAIAAKSFPNLGLFDSHNDNKEDDEDDSHRSTRPNISASKPNTSASKEEAVYAKIIFSKNSDLLKVLSGGRKTKKNKKHHKKSTGKKSLKRKKSVKKRKHTQKRN